jgi:hypothetical protein
MVDRRQGARWRINRPVELKFAGALAPTISTIHDISFRGARISLSHKLPKDTPHRVSVTLCDDFACLNIEMWVVWQKRVMETNVYGVYFTKIKDSDKENIYKFMRKYFPQEINKQWWQETREKGGEEEMEEKKVNNSKDQRIFERFRARLPLRFIDLKGNKEGQAEVRDISAKGLGILAKNELPPQTPLEMWLDIPDRGEPFYTRGEVVWSKLSEPGQWRVGVNLEKADLMGMSRILRTA